MLNEDQAILPAIKLVIETIKHLETRLVSLEHQLHSLQQTANMAAQRPLGGRRPIRCLFIIHYVESWDAYAGVYEAMRDAGDFEPVVATVNRLTGQPERYDDEAINHNELARLNVPHIRLNMADSFDALEIVKAMKPDIIFRQAPWETTLPPAFDSSELAFARLCYVPYSFMALRRYSAKEDPAAPCSSLQTDLPFHRLCWRIFCETEMHKTMFEQTAARGSQNVVCTGYPKFDRLMQARDKPPFWPIAQTADKRRFRLIWAPHHSVKPGWLDFATFPDMYLDMLNWAQTATDIDFVLKPHPALFSNLIDSKIMTQAGVVAFLHAWKALPNTAIVEGADYGPLFGASDAMLTDGIGFLFEYPLLGKPLIYLDNGNSTGFNEAGLAGIEAANRVKSFSEARALCERLKAGENDPKATVIPQVVARLQPYPGQSARRILDAIRAGLAEEDAAASA